MAKKILVSKGVSSTGTVHQLEIEPIVLDGTASTSLASRTTKYKFTVLGPTGKRHASVILSPADKKAIQKFLQDN